MVQMDKTRNGYEKIDRLIEEEMRGRPLVFSHRVRELAKMYGLSVGSVHSHLSQHPLLKIDGHRWVYRSINEREHE